MTEIKFSKVYSPHVLSQNKFYTSQAFICKDEIDEVLTHSLLKTTSEKGPIIIIKTQNPEIIKK